MNGSPLLLLSSRHHHPHVFAAAARAALDVHVEPAAEADEWLERNHPSAILVDDDDGCAPANCEHIRYDPNLANVPLLGISSQISELPFEEMFSSGADDLCSPAEDNIARRLRHLIATGAVPLSRRRGIAVVADSDRKSRVLLARALRNAGYGVTFALDSDWAIEESLSAGVELVVWRPSSADQEGRGEDSVPGRARRKGCTVPWIVGVAPKEISRMRAATAAVSDIAVYDAFGPPENVLFVANDLIARGARESRATARLLYGTAVRFRGAGAGEDEIGYTYNVNAGGLYVRTLAPPDRGSDVWLELRPPRSELRVRLEGRVAWTRGFGTNDAATVPPGFGVQITGGSLSNLERFTRGYHAFVAEMA